MKLLALDSSGLVAGVAIMDESHVIAEYTLNFKKTHSQTLLPMLDELVSMIGLDMKELDAIAVAGGPGSFTGLRIGSATAKGLGLSIGKPLVSVPTLEGLACNLYGYQGLICPMMDARRQQVYTGIYQWTDGAFRIIEDQQAVPVEEILAKCNALGQPVIFLGDGIPVYRDMIEELVTVAHEYAPAHLNRQRAAAVGIRAFQMIAEGRTCTAAEHEPVYLRKSQAERERERKGSDA